MSNNTEKRIADVRSIHKNRKVTHAEDYRNYVEQRDLIDELEDMQVDHIRQKSEAREAERQYRQDVRRVRSRTNSALSGESQEAERLARL